MGNGYIHPAEPQSANTLYRSLQRARQNMKGPVGSVDAGFAERPVQHQRRFGVAHRVAEDAEKNCFRIENPLCPACSLFSHEPSLS
ncbi:hypothetical protein D3C75_1112070 [compost metagenome]